MKTLLLVLTIALTAPAHAAMHPRGPIKVEPIHPAPVIVVRLWGFTWVIYVPVRYYGPHQQ